MKDHRSQQEKLKDYTRLHIFHFRVLEVGKRAENNRISPFGGVTMAILAGKVTNHLEITGAKMGISICSPIERFVKKDGYDRAIGRAITAGHWHTDYPGDFDPKSGFWIDRLNDIGSAYFISVYRNTILPVIQHLATCERLDLIDITNYDSIKNLIDIRFTLAAHGLSVVVCRHDSKIKVVPTV